MGDVKRINDRDLEDLIATKKDAFGVIFMATASIPCDHIRPEIEALPAALHQRLKIYWMDVDENPTITEELSIDSVPILAIYRNEEEIVRYEGPYSKEALKSRIENLLFKKK